MTPRKRKLPSAFQEATSKAKESKVTQRARLIGAGVIFGRKRGKFNNTKTSYLGETYDSLGEAEQAHKFTLQLLSKEILAWERPKAITLVKGPKYRDCVTYKPDFMVTELGGKIIYYDYKGSAATETDAWKIKVKIWRQTIPYELRVIYPTGEQRVVATGNEVTHGRREEPL